MARLYNSADAFVFPSKAEGFGLPCIEAIACGLPMIATDYSGQSTILKNIQGLFAPVDYRLAPIDDIDYRTFYGRDYDGEDFGQWAQPSIQSLRHAMRTIYQEHAAWRERGLQASNIIRSRLSWDQIGTKVLRELTEPAYVPAIDRLFGPLARPGVGYSRSRGRSAGASVPGPALQPRSTGIRLGGEADEFTAVNLCIVNPGYVYSLLFLDPARYLRYHLRRLGIVAR